MPASNHLAAWPDKAMFSAMCLILGGGLGFLFELLRPFIVTGGDLYLFTNDIPGYTLAATGVTLVLGIVCLRTQAALFGYLGALAALLSLGLFGLVSFLGLASIAFMVKAHLEGEETRNDGITLSSDQWPDKALAASMVLFAAGSLMLVQGIAIAMGSYRATLLPDTLEFLLDLAAGVATVAAAREVFHLRRPWAGMAGAFLCIATFGMYVLGPALGIAAFVLLHLAQKEEEFDPLPEVRALRQEERRQARQEPPVETVAR
ncbi:MAG TPA: hypothetical protein VM286_03790 [Candidatus Thermoplasmatota archaeon]|nr:hypothetical protein [Candidatus Thermoplasmatota archaeon]